MSGEQQPMEVQSKYSCETPTKMVKVWNHQKTYQTRVKPSKQVRALVHQNLDLDSPIPPRKAASTNKLRGG